jgi:ATP phosphoribosyltransferase regulatory subunit
MATMIESYLRVRTRADQVRAKWREMVGEREPPGIAAALDAFERRSALLRESGIATSEVPFSGEFGRNVAYYTGFVFEVMAPALGPGSPVAGGGRYDALLQAVGSPREVPAVGAAIHTERLLTAVRGGAR